MEKSKVIFLDSYRKKRKSEKPVNSINLKDVAQNHADEEERIKTLNLFMKVIERMYKGSY